MGAHFQRKRKSAAFPGVADDAVVLAGKVAAQVQTGWARGFGEEG